MKHIASISASVLLLAALMAGTAGAQNNVARFNTDRNRVYMSFGLDPALVVSLGYGRVIPVMGHDFELVSDVGMVAAKLDTHDFRARLGMQSSVLRWRSVHLTGSATFLTRGTDNVVYRGLNFGADVTGTLGVYRPGWFAAAEFGKDKAIITRVTHTDWYRQYYPDAKDGWYLDAGGTYHTGVRAGVTLGKAEMFGRFGFLKTENFKDVMPPMYGSLGMGVGF